MLCEVAQWVRHCVPMIQVPGLCPRMNETNKWKDEKNNFIPGLKTPKNNNIVLILSTILSICCM